MLPEVSAPTLAEADPARMAPMRLAECRAQSVFFPSLPVRQWVLSVPKHLRWYLEREPQALSAVLQILLRVIQTHLCEAGDAAASAADRACAPRRCAHSPDWPAPLGYQPKPTGFGRSLLPAAHPPAWDDAPEPMLDWGRFGQPEPDFEFDQRVAW